MAPGTRLLEIAAQPFLRRLAERPGVSGKLLASLARWQRRLLAEIADLKGRSPVQRLGLFLLAAARPTESGEAEVRLPLTKAQLASRIGITPESLSRAAARLRPVGVTPLGSGFVIADPDKLRTFCGADE
jgi:CRP-like cAMP-binding protein